MLGSHTADKSKNVPFDTEIEGLTMRATIVLTVIAALLAGCELGDENPHFNPKQDYPSWTYDAPFYYRPSEDLKVSEVVGEGIPVYYTPAAAFYVKHTSGYTLPGDPRMALWCSADAGKDWQRAGYFGAEQTHFLFQAEQDGRYWVRFLGPGQDIVQAPPGQPHRIYVVDTEGPKIELSVDPAPFEVDEEGNRVAHVYAVGEAVIVRWRVVDPNLDVDSVHLSTTFAEFPNNVVWSEFPVKLKTLGTIRAPIPPEAAARKGQQLGGMRFRMRARDKAGNLTYAFTDVLRIAGGGKPAAPVTTRPAVSMEVISQTDGTPDKKLGWPVPGSLVRGGTSRILQWLPENMANYKIVVLQFTVNNGRSWRTVAEGLKLGKTVRWTVPAVNSKLCRIRVLAIEGPLKEFMLAKTQAFTVHTVVPLTIMGPVEVSPKGDINGANDNGNGNGADAAPKAPKTGEK